MHWQFYGGTKYFHVSASLKTYSLPSLPGKKGHKPTLMIATRTRLFFGETAINAATAETAMITTTTIQNQKGTAARPDGAKARDTLGDTNTEDIGVGIGIEPPPPPPPLNVEVGVGEGDEVGEGVGVGVGVGEGEDEGVGVGVGVPEVAYTLNVMLGPEPPSSRGKASPP